MARLKIVANNKGIITSLTGDVKEILGTTPEYYQDKSVEEVIPFKYRERHKIGMTNYINTKKKKAMGSWMEVEAKRFDGNTIKVTFCVTERDGDLEAIFETPSNPELPSLDK